MLVAKLESLAAHRHRQPRRGLRRRAARRSRPGCGPRPSGRCRGRGTARRTGGDLPGRLRRPHGDLLPARLRDALPADMDLFWTGPGDRQPDHHRCRRHDAVRQSSAAVGWCSPTTCRSTTDRWRASCTSVPIPSRDPALPSVTGGLLLNLMPLPLASRVGVAAGLALVARPAAATASSSGGRCVAELPGLEPLARACRSWLTDPGPDAELRAWALAACDGDTPAGGRGSPPAAARTCPRTGRPSSRPWLAAWELMAFGLGYVFDLARKGDAGRGGARGRRGPAPDAGLRAAAVRHP